MADINVDVNVLNATDVEVSSPSNSINAIVNLPPLLSSTVTSPTQALAANILIPGPQGPAGIQGPSGAVGPSGATGPTGPSGIVNTGQFDLRYYSITNPSGFISGDLSLYATTTNLASTGSTLTNSINSLSGSAVGSSVLLYGDQSVSGVKTFANNLGVQGTGIFDALDLSNISDFSFSGVTINLINSTVQSSGGNFIVYGSGNFTSGLDLNNSKLINAIPEIINLSTNFNISGNYNSRMIMVNSATEVTGRIVSGNALGFNASLTQVGAAKILITGSGIGIRIGSFNNQYRTAGQFATISLLHTGNNGYIMYGNTAA